MYFRTRLFPEDLQDFLYTPVPSPSGWTAPCGPDLWTPLPALPHPHHVARPPEGAPPTSGSEPCALQQGGKGGRGGRDPGTDPRPAVWPGPRPAQLPLLDPRIQVTVKSLRRGRAASRDPATPGNISLHTRCDPRACELPSCWQAEPETEPGSREENCAARTRPWPVAPVGALRPRVPEWRQEGPGAGLQVGPQPDRVVSRDAAWVRNSVGGGNRVPGGHSQVGEHSWA